MVIFPVSYPHPTQVAGSSEHSNEPSGYFKDQGFPYRLSDYQLLSSMVSITQLHVQEGKGKR
jgi:hypothetical protein